MADTPRVSLSNPEEKIRELINLRDYEGARRLLETQINNDPQAANLYYLLGVISQFQGRIQDSAENLKKALKLNPKHTDAAICLSVLYNDIGAYDKAKSVFEDANQSVAHKSTPNVLDIDRKFALKHVELGDLYMRYRRHDEAVEEYSKAIMLNPTDLQIPIKRSRSYAKKGFVTRAIQELQRIRDENPGFHEARIQLGMLYYSQGNVLDAEIEWEAALQTAPLDSTASSEIKQYLEMARAARLKTGVDPSLPRHFLRDL